MSRSEFRVIPWDLHSLKAETYDALIVAVGFETRARFIAEDRRPRAKRRHATAFTDRKELAYADNEADHSALLPWMGPARDGTAMLVDELREFLDRALPGELRPESILLCANGFAPRETVRVSDSYDRRVGH